MLALGRPLWQFLTLTGRGYRFELPVEFQKQSPGIMTGDPRETTMAHQRNAGDRPKRRSATRLKISLTSLLALAVGWVAIDRFRTADQIEPGPGMRESTRSETAAPQVVATADQMQ
jgi:hypothetical protein